jgi:hypothetical protein
MRQYDDLPVTTAVCLSLADVFAGGAGARAGVDDVTVSKKLQLFTDATSGAAMSAQVLVLKATLDALTATIWKIAYQVTVLSRSLKYTRFAPRERAPR